MPRLAPLLALTLGGLALVVAGCSSDTAPKADLSPTTAASAIASPSSTAVTPPQTTSPAAGATGTAAKVSANNASIAELTTALDAAGVSNAARWAREVDEYRPYPANDPNLPKLRQELAKYNPGPGVVDAIVGTLSLP